MFEDSSILSIYDTPPPTLAQLEQDHQETLDVLASCSEPKCMTEIVPPVSQADIKIAKVTTPTTKPNYPAVWTPQAGNAILALPCSPPPWVIEDLLPLKGGILCSGQPHATKSLNWLCAAIESVTTHLVWGKYACPNVRRVLYIETEDPLWMIVERVQSFAQGLGITDLSGFYLSRPGPFTLVDHEAHLLALVNEINPDWIVFSTLQGLLGGKDWKEQKDMGPVNALMVKLMERAPLVLITHSTQDTGVKRAAGTITQAANYPVTMHFAKSGTKKGFVNVTGDSKMGVDLKFQLRLEVETVDENTDKPRTQVRKVSHTGIFPAQSMKLRIALEQSKTRTLTREELEAVLGTGKSDISRKAISRAVSDGAIALRKDGSYGIPVDWDD